MNDHIGSGEKPDTFFRDPSLYPSITKIRKSYRDAVSNQLLAVLGVIFALAFASAMIVFVLEKPSNHRFETIGDAIWWAFVTITTTGYGDIYPITPLGRSVTVFVVLGGVVTISLLSGIVSSILVARKIKEDKGLQEITVKNHILICGWNRNAEKILSTFRESGTESRKFVLVNELAEGQISNIIYSFKDLDIKFVSGNFTSEEVLMRANIKHAQTAVILADETMPTAAKVDERTLLATLAIKSLNPKAKVYAHITDPASRVPLQRANADAIVLSDQHVGYLLVNHIVSPGIPEAIEDLFDYKVGAKFSKLPIPVEFVGKSFVELSNHIRKQRKSILIGVITEEKKLSISEILSSDSSSYLDEFIRQKFAESGRHFEKNQTQVQLNPPDDYQIQERDVALVIASH
ncbi:MAG: potassium channel family protein [Chlorobiales bacterium]|nr:potassium channel family protein [Chlorobiales bacterium]